MGLCQTPGLPCPKEGESLGWGEKEQTWVEIMNPSRGAAGSGGLPQGTAKPQLSDCSAPATWSNQLEVLICLLDALNTNNSKLKHLNAYLQRPAVHAYSRNICLFKQRRKKNQEIFFKNLFKNSKKKKFKVFSTNWAVSKSLRPARVRTCTISVYIWCHAKPDGQCCSTKIFLFA